MLTVITYCPFVYGPQSQLDAMKLNRLHAATMAPTPSHVKTREEKGEVRLHQRARRSSSDDNSRPKSALSENRITTIPEITESFERRLCLRDKKAMSLVSGAKFLLSSRQCCNLLMQPDRRDFQAEILVKEATADIKAAQAINMDAALAVLSHFHMKRGRKKEGLKSLNVFLSERDLYSLLALERVWLNTAAYRSWTGSSDTCLLLPPSTNRKP